MNSSDDSNSFFSSRHSHLSRSPESVATCTISIGKTKNALRVGGRTYHIALRLSLSKDTAANEIGADKETVSWTPRQGRLSKFHVTYRWCGASLQLPASIMLSSPASHRAQIPYQSGDPDIASSRCGNKSEDALTQTICSRASCELAYW